MIITKEQQEAWVTEYYKGKHTADECLGFIDGVEKVMSFIGDIPPSGRADAVEEAARLMAYKPITERCRVILDEIQTYVEKQRQVLLAKMELERNFFNDGISYADFLKEMKESNLISEIKPTPEK